MELLRSYQDTVVDGKVVEAAVLTPVGYPAGFVIAAKLREALSKMSEIACVTVDLSRLRWLSAALLAALVDGVVDLRLRDVCVSIVGLEGRHARVLKATRLSEVILNPIVAGCPSLPHAMPA